MKEPKLDIHFKYGKIHYINNKSSDEFPATPYSSVMGLTVTSLQNGVNAQSEVKTNPSGGFCVYPRTLKVVIGYPRVDVYIDKKYRPGTCNYKVVKEHENYHARVQLEGLKFFSGKIKSAYKVALLKVKPVEISDPSEAMQANSQIVEQIKADVQPLLEYVNKRLTEENMVIDTETSYEEESRKCPKW
ncbi:MAG: hypothetical protein J6P93_05540 [Alphaproteobacteria bacterium]|nr:hypothetical protein [Alphaproteobacteria bacterium]